MADGIDLVLRWAFGQVTHDDLTDMQTAMQAVLLGEHRSVDAALGIDSVHGRSLQQRLYLALRDREIRQAASSLPGNLGVTEQAGTLAAQLADMHERLSAGPVPNDTLDDHDQVLVAILELSNGTPPSETTIYRTISESSSL